MPVATDEKPLDEDVVDWYIVYVVAWATALQVTLTVFRLLAVHVPVTPVGADGAACACASPWLPAWRVTTHVDAEASLVPAANDANNTARRTKVPTGKRTVGLS